MARGLEVHITGQRWRMFGAYLVLIPFRPWVSDRVMAHVFWRLCGARIETH